MKIKNLILCTAIALCPVLQVNGNYNIPSVNVMTEAAVEDSVPTVHVTTRSTADGVNVVKWEKVKEAYGYVIMRKSLKSENWKEVATIEDNTVVRYEDTDVSADSRYYYTVKAYALDEATGEKVYAGYENDETGVIASVGTVKLGTVIS